MSERIKRHDEIEARYTWRFEDIFPSVQEWEKALKEIETDAEAMAALEGSVRNNPGEAIRRYFAGSEKMNKVYMYASLRRECDNGDSEAQALYNRAMMAYVKAVTASAFLEPELLELPEAELQALISSPDMKDYDVYLKELLRRKAHTLPKEQEKLLAMMQDLTATPDNVFSTFTGADMKFPDVLLPDGTHLPLTEGNYQGYIHHADREIRRQAFEGIMNTYGAFGSTIAALYGASVRKDQTMAEARHYATALEARMDADELPMAVYDNLIAAVHEALPVLHDYLRLRKEKLGLDELHMYDLYVPIVSSYSMTLPFEEAFAMVKEGLSPLGEDYTAKLQEAHDQRWMDVYPTLNKSSGAFSAGSLRDVHPFVLLNHNDNLDSAMTIAHELGHSMHSYYSNTAQPAAKSDYSLFVAEVASICNEAIMMRYLLGKLPEPQAQAYLLNHFLEQFRTTCFRQTMFAEFERKVHDMALRGEPLTRETMSEVYAQLNRQYYGEVCEVDACIANEWMRIPHFYNAYYVFVYATGLCAAVAISERIMREGENAVKDYKRFLSAGCSVPPIEALKYAGIDMSGPEPLRSAMQAFKNTLEAFRKVV